MKYSLFASVYICTVVGISKSGRFLGSKINSKGRIMGLSEILGALQSPTDSSSASIVDSVAASLATTSDLINAQMTELQISLDSVNKSLIHVESNEDARQACILSFNNAAVSSNKILSGMVTGAQLVNHAIDTANKVKRTVTSDIAKLNNNIDVLDKWMDKMSSWSEFIGSEAAAINLAQTQLITWGDETKNTINMHEVGIIELGLEVFNLETSILNWQTNLNTVGQLIGFEPDTLSLAVAASATPASNSTAAH